MIVSIVASYKQSITKVFSLIKDFKQNYRKGRMNDLTAKFI